MKTYNNSNLSSANKTAGCFFTLIFENFTPANNLYTSYSLESHDKFLVCILYCTHIYYIYRFRYGSTSNLRLKHFQNKFVNLARDKVFSKTVKRNLCRVDSVEADHLVSVGFSYNALLQNYLYKSMGLKIGPRRAERHLLCNQLKSFLAPCRFEECEEKRAR